MEPHHFGHHVGGRPVERRVRAIQVGGQFTEPTIGAQQCPRSEPRRQHALDYQDTLGDHQTLSAGQVGPTIHTVEIAEVVESRIRRIADVDYVGAHTLSLTIVDIRSAATSSALRWSGSSRASRCRSHSWLA